MGVSLLAVLVLSILLAAIARHFDEALRSLLRGLDLEEATLNRK